MPRFLTSSLLLLFALTACAVVPDTTLPPNPSANAL